MFSTRNNKSLNLLTKKFVELIKESENGVLSLREVSLLYRWSLSGHNWTR